MTPHEFEDYLVSLTDDQYDVMLQERIAKLNPEQQVLAQAREVKRKYRSGLIKKLADPNEDVQEMVFNALRDVDSGNSCEHDRSYCKHCIACGEIDYLMFPELFDEEGFKIDEEY